MSFFHQTLMHFPPHQINYIRPPVGNNGLIAKILIHDIELRCWLIEQKFDFSVRRRALKSNLAVGDDDGLGDVYNDVF